jgi:hypothetical protein
MSKDVTPSLAPLIVCPAAQVYVAHSPKTPFDVVVVALVADGVAPHETGSQDETEDHTDAAVQVLVCSVGPVATPLVVKPLSQVTLTLS